MSLATDAMANPYDSVLEKDLPHNLRIEYKFAKICYDTFDFSGKIKWVDHVNTMADKLKQEIEKNGKF